MAKENKRYVLCFTFYSFPAAHAQQTATGEGADFAACVSAALEEVKRRPHVRGRQIKQFKITGSLIEPDGSGD